MGTGFRKNRNSMKKQFLTTASKLIDDLQQENEKLKTDPDQLIGQIIPQFREIVSQNKKLSVLAAALITKLGGNVPLSRSEMEAYEGHNLNIKWELPEGVTDPAKADQFVFSVVATKADAPPAPVEGVDLYANEAEFAEGVQQLAEGDSPELPPLSHINLYDDPNFIPPCCAEGKCATEECEGKCPGIQIEEGVFSGCRGTGGDCSECGE